MSYSDHFTECYNVVIEILYDGPKSMIELQKVIEGIIAFMELYSKRDEQFSKSISHHKRQMEIDLGNIINAQKRTGYEEKKDGFNECKKNLITDLRHASIAFMDW